MRSINENATPIRVDSFRMDLFFDLSLDLMCIAGFDGYFKKINPALKKVLGYSDEQLYTRSIDTFVHSEDLKRTSHARNTIVEGMPLMHFENRYLSREGETLWFSWTSVPDKEQQLIYAIAKNITHNKKVEEERNLLIAKLTQSNKQLKELTFTTSHDLRSPVNNLLALFSLVNARTMEKSEMLEFIDMMQLSTEGLKNTLDGYVDNLSQRDVLAVSLEPVELDTSCKKVMHSIRSLIETSKTQVLMDFSKGNRVNFNAGYLESIFLNLFTNSIKYAKPGTVPLISIHSQLVNERTQLVFSDNGIGFDTDKIGDKLFGFRETFHSNADGKGIGLYLVHSHITSLGGKIEAASKPGEGARFTITF
ncbi:PAS domain S-box-containing protein [Cyclobacterium xiamenense]|uniref:histidine kinase n=1 Tax=Cyclobacterium xiamenense TaxID=1297121 RepID=A0A1H6T267_9BACT|nr:PAS domain-containing sensor histidine kinase [Cyclobacterium xiamenense]SEI74183.1 PAS domain S-box-containing protein [Cyclobacterium xiamenense]